MPEGVLDEYGLKIDSPISMTELEIRYGILNKKNRIPNTSSYVCILSRYILGVNIIYEIMFAIL